MLQTGLIIDFDSDLIEVVGVGLADRMKRFDGPVDFPTGLQFRVELLVARPNPARIYNQHGTFRDKREIRYHWYYAW